MEAKHHIDSLNIKKLEKLKESEFLNMLKTLKNQLSDPAHLIPELLQNAEDAGATQVRIQLDEKGILFQHNGARFEAEHVDAICSMCNSTKRGSLNYIGTFGLGFKSTFAISKNPEIHSGGYSFQFNDETTIVPEWITPEDIYSRWNVTIVLPLKDKRSYESVLKQLEGFEKNNAKPMIFLDKLEKISIHRNGTDTLFEKGDVEILELKEISKSFEFVEIKKSGNSRKHFCVYTLQKSIPPDLLEHVQIKRSLELPKGHDYKTNVKIAFEIGSDGHIVPSTDGLLSAFLPTKIRTFLAFDVNAGFLLSTNRESLESVEDEYTCWLIECAVEALKVIIELYKERAPKEFWPDIYRLLPMQAGAREEWIERELCAPIKNTFREGTLLLVSDADNPWRQLHDVIEAPIGIRVLFPAFSEIDYELNGSGRRAYLSEAIDTELRKALVKEFGLTKIDEGFLLDVLARRDVLTGKETTWLLSLFSLLWEKYSSYDYWSHEKKQFFEKARECYLIPCENNSIAKLSEGPLVYRSISGLPDFIHGKVLELRQDLYKALGQDVKEEKLQERQRCAREFMWELIKEATPEKLYNDIIRHEFEKVGDGNLDEQACECLDNYILFLKDKNVSKNDVKLRVKGKKEYKKSETLYFANSYLADSNGRPLYDIEKLLSDYNDVLFVSPHYLELGIDSKDTNRTTEWREFLIKCGVRDFPKFEHNSVLDAKNKEEFVRKFQKEYHQQLPSQLEGSGKPYTGNDWDYRKKIGHHNAYKLLDWNFGDNFLNIIDDRLNAQDKDFFVEFLKMLDCKWEGIKDHLYQFYFYTSTGGGKQCINEKVLGVRSSLSKWLQEMKWLPARQLPDGGVELRHPSEVYLFTPETEGIKGGFYIETDRIRSMELRALLGLDLRAVKPAHETVSIHEETIDDLLEKYSKRAADYSPLDKDMEKFIKKLYLRLNGEIRDGADNILYKLKTYVTRVYDANRNWNELSMIRYYASDIQIIDELRDNVKVNILFLPSGLDPASIKELLARLNKRDLLLEVSKKLPSDICFKEEETTHFTDLANAMWSLLKDERTKDDLKILCGKISEIRTRSTQHLRYELHREADSISNWIETDGILLEDVFYFSGELKDLIVEVATEICRKFNFEKNIKDFIEKVFARSRNGVIKVLKASGKEHEVVFEKKIKTFPEHVSTRSKEVAMPIDGDKEKVIPIEQVDPIKAEIDTLEQPTSKPRSTGSGSSGVSSTGRIHTREETGRRGEQIMEKKILPAVFPDCKIKYVDMSEYDFIVEHCDGSIIYIEIKSSASDEREFSFQMSEKQKDFAEKNGKRYQLWFLRDAWAEKPPYTGPCDFSDLLEKELLKIRPIQETIYRCTVTVVEIPGG
jgi:hypothetical protein